jgi:hypothetical protein
MEDLEQGTVWIMWCQVVDKEIAGLWDLLLSRCVCPFLSAYCQEGPSDQ